MLPYTSLYSRKGCPKGYGLVSLKNMIQFYLEPSNLIQTPIFFQNAFNTQVLKMPFEPVLPCSWIPH